MKADEGGKGKKKPGTQKNSKLIENLKVAVNRGTQAKRSWLRNEREIDRERKTLGPSGIGLIRGCENRQSFQRLRVIVSRIKYRTGRNAVRLV